MAKTQAMRVWYDPEADFLEVMFERKDGSFRETPNDRVMEKVDKDGRVIGFHIQGLSALRKPLNVRLTPPKRSRA